MIIAWLDFETTGTGPDALPIQVGVALQGGLNFGSVIPWPSSWIDPVWTDEAYAVHGIAKSRVSIEARVGTEYVDTVDARLRAFLGRNVEPGEPVYAVGWNVGSFDLPILGRWLPQAAARFHYRSVDLNSVCFAFARVLRADAETLKDAAKAWAAGHLASEMAGGAFHDALYDARASLLAYDWLCAEAGRALRMGSA